MEKKLKLAILDLYDGEPNQGMRAIQEIVKRYGKEMDYRIFDVRQHNEVPDMEYDLFISSGGPGNPLDFDGPWADLYFNWLEALYQWNIDHPEQPKFLFLICHSFQMACHHFGVGQVVPRKSRSFGTFPVHKTGQGMVEPFFKDLPDPFCVADFRDYQVIQPNTHRLAEIGANILALEKIRPHVPLERAIMAIRFSDEIFGVQFHPEADPDGMVAHFSQLEKRALIEDQHGKEKYRQMLEDLKDPTKIPLTYKSVIPAFLEKAIEAGKAVLV
ncbi:MAG: GMP synthase [Bacteroidota bacterium]